MTIFVLCFLASVMFFCAGLYFYDNQGNTAFHKTMEIINKTNRSVEELNTLITSNISTVATGNLRIKSMEDEIKKMRDELDVFRDQVSDTREKQIKLRDSLSRKRPQISVPTGPIAIELYSNPRPATKDFKNIKKKLDGLSK
jgi:chromosome segregation ATPase